MKVKIPVSPWRGQNHVLPEDASIFCVLDQWHENSPGHSVHRLEIGGIEILCQGFTLGVEPLGVFLTLTAHNVLESSWNAYVEAYPEGWMEGSGRRYWVDSEEGPLTKQSATWWAGCDLIVPVTGLELAPLPVPEYHFG